MRIAFDHQAFCLQKTGGISRYFCRLAQELAILKQQVGIFAPLYRNQYLKELESGLVHGYGIKDYPNKMAGLFVNANAWLSDPRIRAWQPAVVHETYFAYKSTGPLTKAPGRKSATPRVITVFDMISELELETLKGAHQKMWASAKFAAVTRADHVICISEHTRQDLLRLFDVPETKTSVIHLGCDVPSRPPAELSVHDKNTRPYLLYVGLRGGYKNFVRLLKAMASSPRLKNNFDLIAFGGNAFNTQERDLICEAGFAPSQIRQMSGSDQVLNQLYAQAAAFVYPSTYEGFGLPPLEAMAQNCPVVSSHRSSMPEVLGQAAEYFDPESIDSMANALETVLFSAERANVLRQSGRNRIKDFTWQRCAQNTLNIYQQLKQSDGKD